VIAVVLVGGEGTRLRPLTYSAPKQMLPVAGVAMIERVLGQLGRHGIEEVVLSMGYRPDAFLAAYPDGRTAGIGFRFAVEPQPLDTAGAIRFAAEAAEVKETFIVVNGDVLTDLDVSGLVRFHRDKGGLGAIALTPVEDPSAFGVVPTDAEGRVEAFIEKPPREEARTNLINAGTYVLEPEVLDLIRPRGRVSVEKEVFPALVARQQLYALGSDAYWMDTGTPSLFIQASLDIVSGRRGEAPPLPGVVGRPGDWRAPTARVGGSVEGPVLLERDVVVEAGAGVRASLIGAAATVGRGATVEDSVVLAGARIGPGATVSRSIIGAGAVVGAGASVGAVSVIGPGAEVPPGARLSEARIPDAAPGQ
jgi:mannose-1-phosphate guanylyltransferase